MPFDFNEEFSDMLNRSLSEFGIYGLLTCDDRVYPFGSDTKVLSTVFELFVRPVVYDFASRHRLTVHETKQNFYPEFTLMERVDSNKKIAIDVKSTYRRFKRNGNWSAQFTLGGYKSFIRNPTKSIAFPYSQYAHHYIVGFIYSRVEHPSVHAVPIDERFGIVAPFGAVEFFVQEKYRIASARPGSGNTTNIGSIVGTSLADFEAGQGPFAALGEEVFLDYWRNYERSTFTTIAGYWDWKRARSK